MIRVTLVDDHPIVLSGLSALVDSDDGLQLIATAGTVREAMEVISAPDVAVVDLELPDGDGIELGVALKERWPSVRVVVLTMHADDAAVMRSLGSGLDGYLLKDSDPEDVLTAIHSASRGTLVLGQGCLWSSGCRRWRSPTRRRSARTRCSRTRDPRVTRAGAIHRADRCSALPRAQDH